MQSLDDRLRALAEALDDPQPEPRATIQRRASQLRRRRRLVQASGALAASVAVVVGAVAGLSRDDGAGDVVTGSLPPTTATTTTPTTASTLPGATTSGSTTASTPPATTTSPPASAMDDPGGLTSATTAIRAACRRFYGSATVDPAAGPGGETTGTSLLTDAELAARCDEPQPEFRADCYAARPGTFVAGDGGCAVLGGYLAVFYGEPPQFTSGNATDPTYRFPVGDDVWWIYPESD